MTTGSSFGRYHRRVFRVRRPVFHGVHLKAGVPKLFGDMLPLLFQVFFRRRDKSPITHVLLLLCAVPPLPNSGTASPVLRAARRSGDFVQLIAGHTKSALANK